MKLGEFDIRTISGGNFRLDGGAMFGVVPKTMWAQKSAPDELNRIQLATNCLLIEAYGKRLLVDTGYGSKLSEKRLRQIDGQSGNPLLENLAAADVSPEDIDFVLFTHLHFDHAGGATMMDEGGGIVPVFPNARHLVQMAEWDDATTDKPEMAGSYDSQELLVLKRSGLVDEVDEHHDVLPGISLLRTGGHTRGHQMIQLESDGQRAIYLGDICPTVAHLKTFWTMAYDQLPVETRRVKPRLLQSMVDYDVILLLDHDPAVRAARLSRDEKDWIVVREKIDLC